MEDKYKAQKKYAKNNIKKLSCSYQAEFVDSFREACNKLGIRQAEASRKIMQGVMTEEKGK